MHPLWVATTTSPAMQPHSIPDNLKIWDIILAGICVRMQAPADLEIGGNFLPFLREPVGDTYDVLLDVQPGAIPNSPETGCWAGGVRYVRESDELWMFYYSHPQQKAYGCVHIKENRITLRYLPEAAKFFAGTTGIFNKIATEQILLERKTLVLHSALIQYRGRGIGFTGPCGIGKSTQAALWEKHMGARVLNGDRAALKAEDNQWNGWGLPYAGSSGIYRNESAPLAALVVLEQAKENRIVRLTEQEALRCLFPELAVHRWDMHSVDLSLALLGDLLVQVPVYRLSCRPDTDAVILLNNTLEQENKL